MPPVIHGSSGIPSDQRRKLALDSKLCKFNVGTELRQVFGASLRAELARNTDEFDQVNLLAALEPSLRDAARTVIRTFRR